MDYAHYGIILGIYTGILLSAFNARLYGIHQYWDLYFFHQTFRGAAATLIYQRNKSETQTIARITW